MGGLINKPRVFWGGSNWIIHSNDIFVSGATVIEVCKAWFDRSYGKGNHGYR